MRTRPLVPLLLLALTAALGPHLPSVAAAPSPAAAGKAARAALPEPHEAQAFAFSADIWDGAQWRGSLRVSLEATPQEDRLVWTSREETRWVGGKTDQHEITTVVFARDLSVERVDRETHQGERLVLSSLTREGGQLVGTTRTSSATEEGPATPQKAPLASDATAGVGALVLLARSRVGAGGGEIEVPWVSLEAGESAAPFSVRKVSLTATAATRSCPHVFGGPPPHELTGSEIAISVLPGLSAGAAGASTGTLFLSGEERAFVDWRGFAGPRSLTATGLLPPGVTFDESQPARLWQHAFLTFGVGYHMAKPELLERAFHWQSMWDYETSLDEGWPVDRPVADLQAAWIKEFTSKSLHRTREATNQLLGGTLASGAPSLKNPDTLVFAAIAQFGGGTQRTYYLRRMPDGIWYLVRMDG